ncbi:hypothetical protein GQ44DRAFT_656653 [Phaeosphaeriaceae sp. PMI808]|nr:hypothetical protein GQ44DRAFT_656653 [Phaeosphaeriaceae sp. PMI808]
MRAKATTDIIHGDLKPENVLIFKDSADTYTARVTDFGYSTRFACEEDLVSVPKSWPWHAPEHDRDRFRPSQARKMDFFSYGMLCTWVLFEKYLSGIMPLPQGAHWAKQDLKNQRDLSKHIIDGLMRDDELIPLVKQLIVTENGIENDKKLTLERFLSSVLSISPLERNARFQELFDCFRFDRAQIPVMEHGEFQMTECNFEITESTYSLYLADYRIRRHIRAMLEEREAANNDSILAFQLAFCYQIGFGGSRDETKSMNMLKKSGKTTLELDEAITRIEKRTKTPHERTGLIFAAMQASGHIAAIDSTDEYRVTNKSEEAEAAFRQDLEGLESCNLQGTDIWVVSIMRLATLIQVEGRLKEAEELGLSMIQSIRERYGDDHPYRIEGMAHLAKTYRKQGSWKEAEALQIQVIRTNAKLLKEGHPSMLDSKLPLAAIYMDLGRWKEAEEVGMQVMETNTRVRGTEHPITLMSMNIVALIYVQQGRWLEAEELQAKVMQTCRSVLGMEHPNTLNAMVNLSVTYTRRGYWRKAEELQLLAVEANKRLIGEEHPDTLNSMTSLASTYVDRGLWNKARRLQLRVMEASKRVLGEEHPNTLISMANLASTYSDLQSWNEAKELIAQVVETSKKVFGEDHPSTLISIGNLVGNYAASGQWKEAEKLQIELVRKKKGVFGEMHPTTLTSLVNLAVIHKSQGDVEKAITLLEKCAILEEQVLGHDHPETELALEFLKEWQIGIVHKRSSAVAQSELSQLLS